jgi:hypothetical protein
MRHFACILFSPSLKTLPCILLSLAAAGGLAPAALACDSCALYIAGGADRPGFTLAVAHQYTRLGTLWDRDKKTGNPIDQYVDSHITQVGLGYSTGGPWHVQLTVPYIARAFFRPDHARNELGREAGLGDITLAGRYRLLKQDSRDGGEWEVHVLGGVELGTGDPDRLQPAHHVHHHHVPSGVHEHDLALGSGSTDWLVGGDIGWTHGRWFARAQVQHAIRRSGAFEYRVANETSWEFGAGRHLVLTHKHSLAVQALFSTDHRGLDSLAGVTQTDTGISVRYLGARIAGTLGQRFAADASVEVPVRVRTRDIMVVPDYRIRAAANWRF